MAKNLIPIDLEDSTPDNTVGTFPDIPDDTYLFEVDNFEFGNDDNDRRWYKITAFIINDCAFKGTTFIEKFTFPADSQDDYSKKGRDRFHAFLLLGLGMDITKRKFGLDPEKIIGRKFRSKTYHHTMPESPDGRFKERSYSRLGSFSPKDEDDADRVYKALPAKARRVEEDDDEDVKPAKASKRVVKDDDEEDEDVKPSKASKRAAKDDDDDDDEDELATRRSKRATKPVVEEEEEDEEDEKPARRRRPVADDDEEDEDAEDEKPARRRAAGEKPTRRGRKPVADDDEEDEEETVFPTRPARGSKPKVVAKGSKRAVEEEDDEDD